MAKKTGYELQAYLSNFNAKFEEKLSQRKNPNLKPSADGLLPNDKVLNEIDKLKEKLLSMESEMQRLLDLL